MTVTVTYAVAPVGGDAFGDFVINGHQPQNQLAPDVLGLSGGGFVCAYNNTSAADGFITMDIYGSSNDHTVGPLAVYADGDQTDAVGQPKLAELANGYFVVVWDDNNAIGADAGPQASIFTAGGVNAAADIDLFGTANSPGYGEIDVSALDDGGFVLSYTFGGDVYFRGFDVAGAEVMAFTQANEITAGVQADSQVVTLADGAFAVVWTDTNPADQLIKARIFEADGQARTGEFNASPGAGDNTQPSIAALKDGGFALVYTDTGWFEGPADSAGLTLQIMSATGEVGLPVQINPNSVPKENDADVTVLENGFIAVTWTYPFSATDDDVYCRVFDATGAPVTEDFDLDTGTVREKRSAVTALQGGQFLTAWEDGTADSSQGSLGAQITEITRTVVGDATAEGFTGDELRDSIHGGAGDDTLRGGAGHDTINGGVQFDWIDGGAGNDLLQGDSSIDTIFGGFGNDRIYAATLAIPGGSMIGDELYGDAGRDEIRGALGGDTIEAGSGDDKGSGGGGADAISGDSGDDKLNGASENDSLDGGVGEDKLKGQAGDDVLEGGQDRDTLNGGVGNDVLFAMEMFHVGDSLVGDALNGVNGNDTLWGSAGGDVLVGGGGNDKLDGGAGGDMIVGASGKDIITGGVGGDSILGGAGKDVFRYLGATDSDIAGADVIVDIDAMDVINLSAIDAKTGKAGDQAFTLVAAFSGQAGELTVSYDGVNTQIRGYTDDDGDAELIILLGGDHTGFDRIVL